MANRLNYENLNPYKRSTKGDWTGEPKSIFMITKYSGRCFFCKEEIPQGKKVEYLPKFKKIAHVKCKGRQIDKN